MNYTLKSPTREATVSALGAELQSITSRVSGEEYMWQGDPEIWSGRAPILFPVVGALKDDQMFVHGQTYFIPKHGFARGSSFEMREQTSDFLKLRLMRSSSSLEIFPWNFEFDVAFKLVDDVLSVGYTVKNLDKNAMYFNIGSHPAFSLPLEDSKISDYLIRFNKSETLRRYKVVDGLLSNETFTGLKNETKIRLNTKIFEEDALVYKNIASDVVSLVHRKKGERVIVSTGGAPHLGIWAKPAAPFVCIEPWFGHADFIDSSGVLEEKESIQRLGPFESFETEMTIKTID